MQGVYEKYGLLDYTAAKPSNPTHKYLIESGDMQRLVSCLAYSSNMKMETILSPEISVDFQRAYDVISQKTELVTTTAMKTSNPTRSCCL
jgi:hypothetical protein